MYRGGAGGECFVRKQRSQSGCWGVTLPNERGGKNEKGRRKGNGRITTEK